MAAEVWMAEQDRTGLHWSPAFEVPAGKAEVKVTILSTGFANEAQGIRVTVRLSNNNKQSFDGGGSGNFWGGPAPTGKDGLPGPRTLTTQLLPENYPTHAQIEMEVSGTVNCGVSVEFLDPTP